MGKIVVNKHFDIKSDITPDKFVHRGELIISNQVGYEGIFIVNKNGEMFFIAPTSGTGADVPVEYKEYIETYVESALDNYLTSEETMALIASGTVNEGQMRLIAQEEISSALTEYAKIDDVITITSEEIAKIVASADTSFDTLKEIADWILNDTTGAAAMANDIENLKTLVTEESVNNWNNAEENAKAYASAYTNSALTEYATKEYVKNAISSSPTGSSNIVFLSTTDYETLVASGSVVVNEIEIVYDETAYYALYDTEL